MACSKFEYVKAFEQTQTLLKNTFIVVRVDGRSFHSFTKIHSYLKPNDQRGIDLMNHAAKSVMEEFMDISLAYGQSDEYSFLFKRDTTLFNRRSDKIISNLVSLFTASFVQNWNVYFPDSPLQSLPCFDARCVLYPTNQNVQDYFSWRQADCHINNLYNTAFWTLVQHEKNPITEREAEAILKKLDSGGKNELLFQNGLNYNNIDAVYRKGILNLLIFPGSTLVRETKAVNEISKNTGEGIVRKRKMVLIKHCDIIGNDFWQDSGILSSN
ncbi:tRNAHis guanylyltransferase-domain-containing protein [Globomyces pollinis-pini]|nr:tRNAHis guanylyltransferase-domain-containing protein [Globomyces pollinis-pini]